MLTSASGRLVGVVHGDPATDGSKRYVEYVTEAVTRELRARGVQILAREHDLRFALHRRIPMVLNCIICSPGHNLSDLRPLITELLVLHQNCVILGEFQAATTKGRG